MPISADFHLHLLSRRLPFSTNTRGGASGTMAKRRSGWYAMFPPQEEDKLTKTV